MKLFLFISFLMLPGTVLAQEDEKPNHLSADLQFFTRGEIRNGGLPQKESEEDLGDQSSFVLSRTRLIVGYDRAGLDAKVSIQHQGLWGQSGKGAFNVHEAWVKLSARNGLFMQAGRHVLAYDDERILGPNDWSMAGISHDALKVGFEGAGHKAHAILAYNQNTENMNSGSSYYQNGALPYKTMQTFWYHYGVRSIPLGASLLFMNIGMQGGYKGEDEHTEWQQLVGGYVKYSPQHWSLEGSYYRQMGKNEDGIKIKAWMASVKGTLRPADSYGFEAGYDFLSGEEYFAVPGKNQMGLIRHDVIRGFSPVYGSHHQFYGAMDFFYLSAYVNNFSPGLRNAYVGGYVKPLKGMRIGLTYHYLAMGTQLPDMDLTLGHEVEMQASYQVMKDATLALGVSYMTGTETMERLKRSSNDGSLRWGWISLNVNPRIFSSKW